MEDPRSTAADFSQSQVVGGRKGHHPADVHRGSRPKQKAVGVHKKEVGVSEPTCPVGLNRPKDK